MLTERKDRYAERSWRETRHCPAPRAFRRPARKPSLLARILGVFA